MVLKMRRGRGFTLLELVVALAVAAAVGALAYRFFRAWGGAAHLGWKRLYLVQSEAAWTAAVENGLLEGRGLVAVSPQTLVFISRGGQRMILEKSGDSALWNGRPVPDLYALSLDAQGPDCSQAPANDAGCRALLDSLDENHDGVIDFSELDRDRDGVVQGPECRYVRSVEIRWRDGRDTGTRELILHPRWRITTPPADSW